MKEPTDEEVLRELGWHRDGEAHAPEFTYYSHVRMSVSGWHNTFEALEDPLTGRLCLEYMGKHSDWYYDPRTKRWLALDAIPPEAFVAASGETHTEALLSGVRAVMKEKQDG